MYHLLANHSLACDTTTNVTIPWILRRIAEVKEKERRKALEEIIYSMIVHKFLDNDISMIPKISPTSRSHWTSGDFLAKPGTKIGICSFP
ncbi:hypothetical protein D5086_006713 [Populus alba]|uniref:Uncharacterized protein n=1 Tax=Populus alba TaxID=43335 RepID=A0ACC4CLS4_POPAL